MKKLSRYLILTILALIIFTMPVMAEGSPIKVFVNGKALVDVVPVVENGRTLVPIRSISEELGFNVEYIEKSRKVYIKKDDRKIEVTMDSNKAKVDDKEVELDIKPFIKDDLMYVPLRFIAESLGEEVIWDGENRIVLVGEFNYNKEIEVLQDILDKYVPEDIFNKDEIFTFNNPALDTKFLYMRIMENKEVLIKIEAIFNTDQKLLQYHLKSYGYDLEENQLTQEEALKLANRFVNKYVDEDVEVIKIPDLYPSLYEENKHESYGDKDGNYVVVVDLEHGFVEYYGNISIDKEETTYNKISAYMKDKSIKAFSAYYELLDFQISNYQEEVVNGNIEAIFFYKIISKNYDKDPDTVGYIKEAKESGNKYYQLMYDEYLQPRDMNFHFKVIINGDVITIYSNVSPIGVEWEETKMTDYILSK